MLPNEHSLLDKSLQNSASVGKTKWLGCGGFLVVKTLKIKSQP